MESDRVFLPLISDELSEMNDTLCRDLIAKHGDTDVALFKGIERGHYQINFFHSMLRVHGASGKGAALKFCDIPAVLELLYLAGLDLTFDDNALITQAVRLGMWKTVDYLVYFHNVSPAIKDGDLLVTAIEQRNREVFLVLLARLDDADDTEAVWTRMNMKLVQEQWWQGITDINRSNRGQFRKLIGETSFMADAAIAGAGYLSMCAIRTLATEHPPIFPVFTEDQSMASKKFLPFFVSQLQGVSAAQEEYKRVKGEEMQAAEKEKEAGSVVSAMKTDF